MQSLPEGFSERSSGTGCRSTLCGSLETLRGQGYGRKLLREAEQLAQSLGCKHAKLDIFDFEARGFYEKEGYRLYGALEGFPQGHTHYRMKKELGNQLPG